MEDEKFSDRVKRVEQSATVAVKNLVFKKESQGLDIVNMSVGDPDLDTPSEIVEAANTALREGQTGYTASNGIRPLRKAIASKLRNDGIDCDHHNIIVTPGAKQALFESIQSVINPGDEVIILDPSWVSYAQMVNMAGGSRKHLDLAPHDFQLEPALDELNKIASDETQLLIINSPNNPTGAVYSKSALRGVRDIAVDHDITVISDEIYQHLTYESKMTSLASLSGMEDRTVTINGFSKRYAMTGWRLGYLCAPDSFVTQAGKIQSHTVSCAVNFVQHAGVKALNSPADVRNNIKSVFSDRRDLVIDILTDYDVKFSKPDGAFYIMIPVDDDDQSWCKGAVEDARVATVPGTAFGAPGYARISFTTERERIKEGFERLRKSEYI